MAYSQLTPIHKKIIIVVGLTVVGFMAFGLALSFYRNALFEQTLADIKMQNNTLRENILFGYKNLEYYRSAQYKDKYAKENLGKIKPGENVLIITEEPENVLYDSIADLSPTEQQEAAYLELLRQMPIFEHWKLYLFHKDKIEDIKLSL